jgi:hypothetical protein
MGLKFGFEAKLYYKVGGVAGAGNWVELKNAKDVTLSVEKGKADVTTRAANGWKASKGTLKDATIEWEMVWDTGDAGFAAIQDAFFNNKVIGIRCLDCAGSAEESAQGLEADMDIINFSRKEPLEEALTVSVSAAPTYSETPPAWVTVGTGGT